MRDGQVILGQVEHNPVPGEVFGAHSAGTLGHRVLMPKRINPAFSTVLLAGALLLVGCQRDVARHMFAIRTADVEAAPFWVDEEQSAVILAGVFDDPTSQPGATTQPDVPTTQAAKTTTQPVPVTRIRPYTRPRAVRQSAFLALLAASMGATESSDTRTGSEASEHVLGRADVRGSTQVFGPSGATTVGIMQASVIVQSASRPGLQQGGPLTGALPFNIFAPTRNTIGQRCPELVTAGFFADLASCQNHFQP